MSELLRICGRNIRQYRKKKDLTLGKMSRGLGITGAYLGYLERGQRNPSLLTLGKIADILEISPDLLLRKPQDKFDEALNGLHDLLVQFKEVEHVIFLKEVMESYLRLLLK
ncbi:helix-turn-helix domain-containing protein [Pelotomaculum propionicicum]|uniref:HTH-type transcriptional regulator SinR n=1 Tax=Pelotomaculum propionicicum TaxID=258475 RepID=A0A4Y7RXI5_9FIRM|nr:helix-turn-helix transcriptional regulator [Pelotomaculum propionicicum]TEB13456.1 HTH-type transcriptional regulator SinR [Pelotomaculum propionicicum]